MNTAIHQFPRINIRKYILENFLFTDDDSALDDEESLLEQGIIDSTGALEIANYLEETFDIKIRDDEMLPENLDSIASISRFILRKAGDRYLKSVAEARVIT